MATPQLTRSPKLYMERRMPSHRTTRRTPAPHLDPGIGAEHSLVLKPPYPTIDVLHAENDKPPAAALTEVWPYGSEEIT